MKLSKEEYELLLHNIAAAVILHNDNGSITFCSSYIQVLTGFTYKELSKNNPNDIFDSLIFEEDKEKYLRAKRISSLGEDSLVRFRINHKSGLVLWLESRMVPLINEEGMISSVMSITIDVTDTLQYQKQIEEQNQDLSDFAYMVSHDLKAPIFTIQGMTEALKEDFSSSLGEEGLSLLSYISSAAKRLQSLVSSVLEYSELANTDETTEVVSLKEIVSNVMSDFSEQIKKTEAKVSIDQDLPEIKGEPVRIYQLFSNLVGNSIKYRSPDRTLELEITKSHLHTNHITISIKDNGIGIPENKLEDIFRPYRRAHKGEIEGSGIGLACVKKIMDKIGGKIEVISTEGQGSTFVLNLPLSKPAVRQIPKDLERIF